MSKKRRTYTYTRRKKRQIARRVMRGGDVLPPLNDQIVEKELETNWQEAKLENLVAVNEKIAPLPLPLPTPIEHPIFTDNMEKMYKYKKCKTMFNTVKNTPECKKAETDYCDTPVDIGGINRQQFDDKYAACCPTNFFGMSNKSPRCQQMNQKYKDHRQNQTYKADNVKTDDNGNEIPRKKPWYRFWGGKRREKRRETKRREKRRHRL